jgi:hypothetical protein
VGWGGVGWGGVGLRMGKPGSISQALEVEGRQLVQGHAIFIQTQQHRGLLPHLQSGHHRVKILDLAAGLTVRMLERNSGIATL